MKKLLLVGAMALFGAVNAQMQKGSWVVSGSTGLGFNSLSSTVKYDGETDESPKVSIFTLTPSAGYFVKDNLSVGLDLGFLSGSEKEDGDKTSMSIFSILPTATYYFYNEGKVIPYLGAGVGYSSITSKETYDSETTSTTTDGFTWKVKGGFVYMVTPSVGIDLGLGYNQFSNKRTEDGYEVKTNVNNLGVNAGLSFFFKGKSGKKIENN